MPDTAQRPVAGTLAVMVTRRCNMACAHCSVESNSRIRGQPTEAALQNVVKQAADAGVKAILFTGGEPMLREDVVTRLIRVAKRCGLASAITTNGFWGASASSALQTLKRLRKAGLSFFTLSYDRYHAQFQGPERGVNILKAAESLGVPMNINVTRVADDTEIGSLLDPFQGSRHAKLRVYDVQPVGRARQLDKTTLRGEMRGRCQACEVPAVTDDGRLTACNGPSYFQPEHSALAVGSTFDKSLSTLLEQHRDDPILQTLRTFGPERLRSELSQIPGFENFPWRDSYSGLCDLCLQINSDREASSALRQRLSQPQLRAERTAKQLVLDGVRERGETGREHVVGVAAARLWMRGARNPDAMETAAWEAETARVFGRADADWLHMAAYISACGLSNALLSVVRHRSVTRWAPAMFVDSVASDALIEARRELVQRRVLRIIASELDSMRAQGVLLKGAAILFREMMDPARFGHVAGMVSRRGATDIDLLVAAPAADELRRRLIRAGGKGKPDERRTAPHHLAPVVVHGVPVEIHTRIMPSFWALPESDLMAHLWKPDGSSLATLDAEGMLLHTLMHSASHLFGSGLKGAWDVAWILDRHANIDYDRVIRWAERCPMSAGFWLPARIIRESLELPMPSRLFDIGADAPRYAVLERVLRQRMFVAMETTAELNPISKHAVFMLLHSTWRGRILHASSLFKAHEREARSANPAAGTWQTQLKESYSHFQTFRQLSRAQKTTPAIAHKSALFDQTGDAPSVRTP